MWIWKMKYEGTKLGKRRYDDEGIIFFNEIASIIEMKKKYQVKNT